MTQDEIIEMARQADVQIRIYCDDIGVPMLELEAFAKLVAEAAASKEREACAKLCDELDSNSYPYVVVFPNKCAEAIRARGEA